MIVFVQKSTNQFVQQRIKLFLMTVNWNALDKNSFIKENVRKKKSLNRNQKNQSVSVLIYTNLFVQKVEKPSQINVIWIVLNKNSTMKENAKKKKSRNPCQSQNAFALKSINQSALKITKPSLIVVNWIAQRKNSNMRESVKRKRKSLAVFVLWFMTLFAQKPMKLSQMNALWNVRIRFWNIMGNVKKKKSALVMTQNLILSVTLTIKHMETFVN